MHSPLDGRLPAVFVHVRDMQRAVEFYTKVLGLPIAAGTDFHNNIFVFKVANGVDLILDANRSDEIAPPDAVTMHVTCMFSTNDIDASYQFMKDNQVELVTEVFRDPNVQFFNFKDPDGNIQMVCASKQ